MIELADKVKYVDSSLEAAELALNNETVIEQLGPNAELLVSYLGRLVPILSSDDAERMPEVLSPDAVPLLVIGPNDVIRLEAGADQFSTTQEQSAKVALESWNSRRYTPDQMIDSLLGLSGMNPNKDYNHRMRPGTQAALYSDDMVVRSEEFRSKLTLANAPKSKAVRVSYRPMMHLYMPQPRLRAKPQVLLHELSHLREREAKPIHHYSTQLEIDTEFLRDELEAYHIGAVVLEALSKAGSIQIGLERDANAAVERARLTSPQFDTSDPFKPNRMLMFLLDDEGFGIDTIVGNRLNLSQILDSMTVKERTDSGKPEKVAKNKRYTPPKNKR